MLSEKILRALNEQINHELYSAYLYAAMAAYFDDRDLPGFAHWTLMQAQEELMHAQKIFGFVSERGGRVRLASIAEPDFSWDSNVAAFEAVLAHERFISGKINDIVDLALQEKDHATNNFLQWFVAEQVEEEASAEEVLRQVRLVGDAPSGLFMLDRELAKRTAAAAE